MKSVTQPASSDEPMGIVISGGAAREQRPVFRAFVWAPAPEPAAESSREPSAA